MNAVLARQAARRNVCNRRREQTRQVRRLGSTAIQAMASTIVDVRKLLEASQLSGSEPAAEMICQALERVTIIYAPNAPEEFMLKVDGKLDAFTRRTAEEGICVTMVAEEGLEPPTRGL